MKYKFVVFLIFALCGGDAWSQILVPFVNRYNATQQGGLVMIGNTMLSCNGSPPVSGSTTCTSGRSQTPPTGSAKDNDYNSAYVDVDGVGATFSSSSADLSLASCSKVTFAGLYWGAYINTGNSKYNQRNQVKIKTPTASSYVTLTADTMYDLNSGYAYYTCFKDVTSIVAAAGNGTFTIADMVAITGGSNQWGGWSIVIAYKNDLLTSKNITVFDGLGYVTNSGSSVTVNVNGFYTPPSGAVNFELGEIAYDGDRALTGDSLLFKGSGSFLSVSDALHPANDVFNSSMTNNGVEVLNRNPSYSNTLGYDQAIFKPNNAAKNYLGNGASSAQIKVTTGGEQIYLRVLTSVIDTYEPDLAMQKNVSDINGGAVNPGDTLLYTINVTNTGNDTSTTTIITDTLPFNAEYVPGTINITAGPNTGLKTDASGDDQAEATTSGGYKILTIRLGNGASGGSGGQLPNSGPSRTTSLTFRVRITDDCTKLLCDPVIANRADINYVGKISGFPRKGKSNPTLLDSLGCPIDGSTSTNISVPVSCTPAPDSSIGGCLPLVFSTVPGIRTGYVYFNSSWTSVTSASVTGTYYGIRYITGTSCADTIRYIVYVPVPTSANAGPDQNHCNVTSSTMAANSSLIGSGSWSTVSGPNVPSFTTVNSASSAITGLITGTYVLVWTITTGCNSTTDTVIINNSPLPVASNAGSNQSLCNVSSTTLAANSAGAGTGLWSQLSGPNSAVFTTPSSPTSTVTGMIAGVYDFRWSISRGVCAPTTSSVQITVSSLPTVSNAGLDQSACNVPTVNLAGNNPASGAGSWMLISGPNVPVISAPGTANTSVTGLIAGVYTFRWTISNGTCVPSIDDVQVTIYSLSSVSNAGPDQNLCNVTSTSLAGNAPAAGSGVWTLVSGPNSPTIMTPSSPTSTVTGMIIGVYNFRWTITNGVCASSIDDVQITIFALPSSSNAGPDQNLCNVTSTTLAGNSPAIGAGTWTRISGPNTPTITTPSSPTSGITAMISGVYVFRWSILNGACAAAFDDVQITIYAIPTSSNAGSDQNLCNVTSSTLSGNTPTVGSGNWSLVSGPNSPTIASPSSPLTSVSSLISGVYIFRWTISSGVCSSSADDMQLTVYAPSSIANAGADQNLCNVTSSTFAGNVPAAGTGNWTLISGPNSPVITTPSSAVSTVNSLIPGVYVFRWTITNGVCPSTSNDIQITIFNLPTTSDAGVDQSLCNVNGVTLAGNSPVTGIGTWTLISGPNSPVITTPSSSSSTVTGMIAGAYTFRWSILNGVCAASTDDVQISIFSLPTISNAGSDQNLCNVTGTTFSGNNPLVGTGVWTLVSGPNIPTITTPTNRNSTITGMIAGIYIFSWTISNGVCSSSSDDVQINNFALPTTSNAGADQSLCNVNSTILAGNTPVNGSGLWTLISGPNLPTIVTASTPGTSVTGMIAGVYIFRWTTSNGVCATSTDDVQITIYTLPTNSTAGSDQSLCNVSSVTLSGNTAVVGTGTWTVLSGPNVPLIVSPNSANSSVTGMIPGVYVFQWSIINGVCAVSNDDVQITIFTLPTISNAGADQNLCNVSMATLAGNNPISGSGIWSFISGPNSPGITTPAAFNSTVTSMIPGVYIFRWTISNGICAVSEDDIQVTIYDLPSVASAGGNQDVCSVTSVTLNGNAPAIGTGTWSLLSGPNVPVIVSVNNPASMVTGMTNGVYVFTWTINNGVCAVSTSNVTITIYNQPTAVDAGPDQSLCNVVSATMAGNVPAPGFGTWSFIMGPNTPVISLPNDPASSITGLITGTYMFGWTVTNGACSSPVDTIVVLNYALPTTSNAGANQDLCSVTSVTLNGNTATVGSGLWTLISGPNVPVITNASQANSTVTGMIDGVYSFQWAISNGPCIVSSSTVQMTIYNSPTIVNAGPDQGLCNVNSTTMSGNVPGVGTGTWIQISGPNAAGITLPNDPATTLTGLTAGIYVFGWSISNGVCITPVDSVNISVFDLPTIANAGPDQSNCNLDSVTLAANAPAIGAGTWTFFSGPNSPLIADSSNESTKVNGMIPGVYKFIWTISNGACATSTDTVVITIYKPGTMASTGPNQYLCNRDSVVMSANNALIGSGIWTVASGPNIPVITNVSSASTSITSLVPGTYYFVWTITNGVCPSSADSVEVNVYALPTVANAGPDQNICNANNGAFAANTPLAGSGIWTLISGPNVPSVAVASSPVSPFSGLIQGLYKFRWAISNGSCVTSADTVQIYVYDLPTVATAGMDQEFCGATTTAMSANAATTGTGLWTLTSGPSAPVIANSSSPTTNISGLIPGVYIFNWAISNGSCVTSSDEVEVTIYEYPPFVDAGVDQYLCNVTSVSLPGNAGAFGTSFWSQLSGPNSPTIVSPSSPSTNVTGMIPGIYTFSLNVVNGVCAAYGDTVLVSIDALPTVSNAGLDQSLCNVTSVSMTANNPISGTAQWNLISGPNIPVIANPNGGNTIVSNLIEGVYIFTWNISNGVCAFSNDTVQISIFDLPLNADAGLDQSLCNVSVVSMAGNVPSAGTGTWSLIGGPNSPLISDVNDPFTGISGMIAGNYIFGWTINNGVCSTNTDSIFISIFDTPTVAIAGADQDLCNDSSTFLDANNFTSGSGTWSQVSGPNAANFNSMVNPITEVTGLIQGTYLFAWTISNGSCAISSDTAAITIYGLPFNSSAGADQSLCITSPVIMTANTAGTSVGTWTLVSGPNVPMIVNPNSENTAINGMVEGVYIFRWTIEANLICPSSFDDVQIEIFAEPTAATAGLGQTLCNVWSITLLGNTPTVGTGVWMLVSGPAVPAISNPGISTTNVAIPIGGSYVFSWTISNGVCASSSATTQVRVDSLPTVSSSGVDQDVCVNSVLTLTGNNPVIGIGTWTNLSGPNIPVITAPASPVTTVSGFTAGVYNFVWTITNGICSAARDTVQVTVYDSPNTAIAGTAQYQCATTSITLNGNAPINSLGQWTMVSGPNFPVITDPDSASTNVTGLTYGVYIFRWTISNGVCLSNSDDVRITIYELPILTDAGPDQNLCAFNAISLTANTPLVGTGSWALINGPNVPSINSASNPTTTVSGFVTGTYDFRWTVDNGLCSQYDEVSVVINQAPNVYVSKHSFNTCEGKREVTLEANGAASYQWSPAYNLSNSSVYNPTALVDQAMTYVVVGTDQNGCWSSDTVIIEVCNYIIIPTGFSPNGDGVNDYFEIVGITNFPGNMLRVFNRWGNLLYEKKEYDNSWNAFPNVNTLILGNDKVPPGTYYYLLDLGIADKPKNGYIIIKY